MAVGLYLCWLEIADHSSFECEEKLCKVHDVGGGGEGGGDVLIAKSYLKWSELLLKVAQLCND